MKYILILIFLLSNLFSDEITTLDEDFFNKLKKMNMAKCAAFERDDDGVKTDLDVRASRAMEGKYYFVIFYNNYKVYLMVSPNQKGNDTPKRKFYRYLYGSSNEKSDLYMSKDKSMFQLQTNIPGNMFFAIIYHENSSLKYVCKKI